MARAEKDRKEDRFSFDTAKKIVEPGVFISPAGPVLPLPTSLYASSPVFWLVRWWHSQRLPSATGAPHWESGSRIRTWKASPNKGANIHLIIRTQNHTWSCFLVASNLLNLFKSSICQENCICAPWRTQDFGVVPTHEQNATLFTYTLSLDIAFKVCFIRPFIPHPI